MIPVFSVVLCSLSFHWIEHVVMELAAASPSFFKRRNQKNKRKKKKNKRKATTSGYFQLVKRMV
jgi:ATP/ADP translocase